MDAVAPARRAAAIALARTPANDPWAYAQAVAVSSPTAPNPTCGLDEEPEFGDAHMEEGAFVAHVTKPAGPDYAAAMHRIDQALRLSPDPFDRAVADAIRADRVLVPAPRLDALVQDAVSSSDPRVYALAYGLCSHASAAGTGCQQLSARQWANLDPGNAVPWLFLFNQAASAGDLSGEQEAMAHMAASARFDQRSYAVAGAIAEKLPDDDATLAAKFDLIQQSISLSASGWVPYSSLVVACRDKAGGDVNRVQQCEAVSDLLFDHADSLLSRSVGGALFKQATGDSSHLDAAHAELRAISAHSPPAASDSPCNGMRDMMKRMLRNASLGEVEAARERMRTLESR